MTIYNSQRVNNDPQPYLWRSGERTENPSVWGNRPPHTFNPRPEYDNNPNPVLQAFRKESDWGWLNEEGKAQEVREWIGWLSDKSHNIYLFQKHEHIEHAHRVLTKLINVYKETA